ncbi:hypothetical protein PR048_031424, partial [Dryococelus australis]
MLLHTAKGREELDTFYVLFKELREDEEGQFHRLAICTSIASEPKTEELYETCRNVSYFCK